MILNPDKDMVKTIKEAIKEANGYCPCNTQRTSSYICPCIEMREQNICRCGLFIDGNYEVKNEGVLI